MNKSGGDPISDPFDFDSLTWIALYLGIILLSGYAMICTLLKTGKRHWLEVLGFSFAGGCAVVTWLLFLLSLAGAKPGRVNICCIGLTAVIVILAMVRGRNWITPTVPTPRRKSDAVGLLGMVAFGLILVVISHAANRAGWSVLNEIDSFAIWLFKAKWVALKPLLPVPPEFHDPALSYSHQDYPLGFPLLIAGLFAMTGRINDRLVQPLLVPIFLALLAIMYTAIRRQHRRAMAVIITAVVAAGPAMTVVAGSPVPESMLILFYSGALSLLLRWMQSGERGDLLLAGLFASGAAFTKNEGLAMLPVLGVATLFWAIIQRRRRALVDCLASVAICLLAIGPWLIYRAFLPRTHEDYGDKLKDLPLVIHNLSRVRYVMPSFVGWMFDTSRTGLLYYLLILCALLCPRALKRTPVVLLWLILLTQLLIYLLTLIVTPWDVQVLLPMITWRLLSQTMPPAAFLIALHLKELAHEIKGDGDLFNLE